MNFHDQTTPLGRIAFTIVGIVAWLNGLAGQFGSTALTVRYLLISALLAALAWSVEKVTR